MREALQQLIDYCPRSFKNLSAHVVLLTGKTDDLFILDPAEGLVNLEHLLFRLYGQSAERALAYSLPNGLRTFKEPPSITSPGSIEGEPERDSLSVDAVVRRARQEHAAEMGHRATAESIGKFVNSPVEALRHVNGVLRQTENCFIVFSYSPTIQLAGEVSPDIAPLLEHLPNVCRDRNHVVVFAAPRMNPTFNEVYTRDSQKISRLPLGGPSIAELECALLYEEVRQRRLLLDVDSRQAVIAALEYQGSRPGSGLKTIVDNILRHPKCFLDSPWARQNGAHGFDLSDIDVDTVRDAFDAEIMGQAHVKKKIIDRLRRLREFGRQTPAPFLRLLCVGPSGVGKTEMAKILCRKIFGSEDAMVTVAGTEYNQEHEVAKLLGAPPGFTGYDQPALLESHRQRWPAGLMLLDEFEKAHHRVQEFFMNILHEGKATSPRSQDGQPIILDFSSYVVVATSNAGAREVDLHWSSGEHLTAAQREGLYFQELKKHFRAELLGRFDDRLVFDFLNQQELEGIAKMYGDRQLERFRQLCRDKGRKEPEILVDPLIYQTLVRTCDPAFGARDLRQIVESVFQDIWLNKYAERRPLPDDVEFLAADLEPNGALA